MVNSLRNSRKVSRVVDEADLDAAFTGGLGYKAKENKVKKEKKKVKKEKMPMMVETEDEDEDSGSDYGDEEEEMFKKLSKKIFKKKK